MNFLIRSTVVILFALALNVVDSAISPQRAFAISPPPAATDDPFWDLVVEDAYNEYLAECQALFSGPFDDINDCEPFDANNFIDAEDFVVSILPPGLLEDLDAVIPDLPEIPEFTFLPVPDESSKAPSGIVGASTPIDPDLPDVAPMNPTCNSDVMQAIETRAWLSAQREITVNQNLIAKPDSVLEYTCFDKFLNVLAQEASDMFSENEAPWSGSVALVGPTDMDNALTDLVGNPAKAFTNTNFDHSYIGGRGPTSRELGGTVSGGSYTCDEMNKVWKFAKCMNFAAEAEDGFLTYEQHKDDDPRRYPEPCDAEDPRWSNYIQEAFDAPEWRTNGSPTYDSRMTSTHEKYSDMTEPGNCSAGKVKTGITYIDPATLDPEDEYVCVNPGCSWSNDSNSCE